MGTTKNTVDVRAWWTQPNGVKVQVSSFQFAPGEYSDMSLGEIRDMLLHSAWGKLCNASQWQVPWGGFGYEVTYPNSHTERREEKP